MNRSALLVLAAWCLFGGCCASGAWAEHTWFQGKGTVLSAYYVYVTRK
jgi:hypothetical protein